MLAAGRRSATDGANRFQPFTRPPAGGITWTRRGRRLAILALGLLAALGAMPQMRAVGADTSGMVAVIVRGSTDQLAAAAVAAVGGHVTRRLEVIGAVSAEVPASRLDALEAARGVAQVTPDAGIHLLGSTYLPGTAYAEATDPGSAYSVTQLTGAQAMWAAGYTGKGVDVALIDSGVSPVAGLNGTGKLFNGPDLSVESQSAGLRDLDTFGHGTFMAGLIAGRDATALSGAYAGDSTDFLGMAPDARILSLKVADSHGTTDVSQVIAAISWVMQHRFDNGLNVRVLNLSFGTDSTQAYVLDPLAFAAEKAWQTGIVVVASAGNAGWKTSGLTDPAYDPYLLAVGAADNSGTVPAVARFSSNGDGVRNPDLLAPGRSLQSLRDPNSYIDANYGSTGLITSRFFRGSGTSEAAAVVSGAAALLLQQRPAATPDEIKAILTSSATPLPGAPAAAQGNGEINLNAAQQAPTTVAAQVWPVASGTGTLEGSRGSVHITMGGVQLNGEKDIFGAGISTVTLAQAIASSTAWTGGNFNGNTWSGNTWSGNTWSGNTWTGNSWSGNTWTGNTWSGNTWTGNTWSGNTWSGNTWSGSTWSGNTWSSSAWN